MSISVAEFRKNIYKVMAEVAKTGKSAEIVYKGEVFVLFPDKPSTHLKSKGRLARLKKRSGILVSDSEELLYIDWSKEWRPCI